MEIGLRRVYDSQLKYKSFVIEVIDPDGIKTIYSPPSDKSTVKKKVAETYSNQLNDNKWVNATYPNQFKTKKPLSSIGIYTIIWKIDNKFLTCHQFEINQSTNDTKPQN